MLEDLMFHPLPQLTDSGGWISDGVITEGEARAAISRAATLQDEAQQALAQARSAASDCDPLHAKAIAEEKTRPTREAARLSVAQAIMFSAMHIEGSVNAWGVISLGEDFYKNHLERSRLESKIAILLVVGGAGLVSGGHPALEAVRLLFERRNQLAHRKTREVRWPLERNDLDGPCPIADLDACEAAVSEFKQLVVEVSELLAARIGGFDADGNAL